jgi:hypothetical protein
MARFLPSGLPSARKGAWIESFHFILSYLHDPDGVVQNNLLAAGARQLLYGSRSCAGTCRGYLIKPLESFAIYESGPASSRTADRLRNRATNGARGWA